MQRPVAISIIEDLDEIREGMKDLVTGAEGLICLSTYADAETAMADLPRLRPDIVVMDINLPGKSGIDAIRYLAGQCPDTQFLMFTIYEDDKQVFEALKAGASGYLLKNTPPDKILEALRELYDGGAPMSARIARKVVASMQEPPVDSREDMRLTLKEKEVLDALARGYLYKEIAAQLQINVSAVRQRIHKIYQKLHVQNRTEALNRFYGK